MRGQLELYELMKENKSYTCTSLAEETGLQRSNVTIKMSKLVKLGLVKHNGETDPKKIRYYKINTTKKETYINM